MQVVRIQPCNLLSVSDSITDESTDKVVGGFGGSDEGKPDEDL